MTGTRDADRTVSWLAGIAIIVAAAVIAGAVTACSKPAPEQELTAALEMARSAARDSTRATEAIGLLEDFVRKHPGDGGVPEALLQLAILRQQQGDVPAAVRDYERILAEFPAAEVAVKAQFMIAFVSEEHLGDYDAARHAYQAVIDNYPQSELAAQAQQLLEHVGQTPDAWVRFHDDEAAAAAP